MAKTDRVLELPLDAAVARFPPALAELEADGERTLLRMRAESLDWVARLLANAGCEFTVRGPDGLGRVSARRWTDQESRSAVTEPHLA